MSTRRDGMEREWDAQERALRAERAGEREQGDVEVAEYRLVARALRTPPIDALPADFAARTAARVESQARATSERVEVWLERGLVALLLVAGVVATLVYSRDSLLAFSFSVPERAALGLETVATWSLAVAACVGLSSIFARARRR
jgi:hypothetical protein